MAENSQVRQKSPANDELKQTEIEIATFSARIDGILRKHYASRIMRKLLVPPTKDKQGNIDNRVILWMPSWISIGVGLFAFFFIGSTLSSLKFLPLAGWISFALTLLLAWGIETKLLPKLYFSGYRFRLMRMEERLDGEDFPDKYIVARSDDSPTGFGSESWKPAHGVKPGHLLISISNPQKLGVAIVYLRTEGMLAVSSWTRDLFMDNVLPSLPEEVKTLAY